ncbi:hypothetical protein ACFX12_015181 [Malus domestica]
MLAVFDKSVAKCPEALQSPQSGSASALKDGFSGVAVCFCASFLRHCQSWRFWSNRVLARQLGLPLHKNLQGF